MPQKIPVIANDSEFKIIDTGGKNPLNTQFWHWLISLWLANEGNKYHLTSLRLCLLCCIKYENYSDFTLSVSMTWHINLFNTKNYVHKYPCSFAYENITSSIVSRLTGQWHYSLSMKDFLPVWARICFSRGENQTDFCGWISNVLSLFQTWVYQWVLQNICILHSKADGWFDTHKDYAQHHLHLHSLLHARQVCSPTVSFHPPP